MYLTEGEKYMAGARHNGSQAYLNDKLKTKLDLILSFPTTIVTAPLGYGKTVAIREYFRKYSEKIEVYWSCVYNDSADGFITDFSNAFEAAAPEFAEKIRQIGLPKNHTDEREFIQLMNGFCFAKDYPVVLVLDQIDISANVDVQQFIYFLSRQIPANFHMVLIGRSKALSIDDLFQFDGSVNYINCEDFELDLHDIEEMGRLLQISLPTGIVNRIYAYTGGWKSLVYLNLKLYEEKKEIYSREEMMNLIERVIFNKLGEEEQALLKAISVCGDFTKEQALYLCADEKMAIVFERLCQDNFFIRLNRKTGTYYIFEPIKAYLDYYNKKCPKQEYEDRINRLAYWFLKTTYNNPEARRLFYSIRNYDALMEAVERRRFLVYYGLDEQEFISYYTDCPLNIRAKHPKAVITFARQMFSIGNYEMGQNVCREFETIIEDYQGEDRNNLLGTYELLLSYVNYNDLSKMIEHLQKAKVYSQGDKYAFLWPETELNESYSLIFMFYNKPGNLENTIALYKQYAELYAEVVNNNLNGTIELIEAERAYYTGNLLEADILLNRAILKIQRSTQWNTWLCAILLQIRVSLVKGEWENTERLLTELREAVKNRNEERVLTPDVLYSIFTKNKLGVASDITKELSEYFVSKQLANMEAAPFIYAIYGECLACTKNAVKFLAAADDYLQAAKRLPNTLAEIELEIETAAAYESLSEAEKASRHLKRALELAEKDQMVMVFAEHYRSISSVIAREKTKSPFMEKIIAEGKKYQEKIGTILGDNFTQLNHGLTSRELEIAKLAAKRLSNREIASRLNIAETTVKTQLSRVFSKLDIKKRYELAYYFPG